MSEWISVEDRLPERNTHVLVWTDGQMFSAWYLGDGNMFARSNTCEHWLAGIVTHWQPLPEPPKSKGPFTLKEMMIGNPEHGYYIHHPEFLDYPGVRGRPLFFLSKSDADITLEWLNKIWPKSG